MTRRPLKVLLINQYYPPDTSATANILQELVIKLSEAGYRVRVICGRPSYNPDWKRESFFRTSHDSGVSVHQVRSSSVSREQMWGRVVNYLTFAFMATIRVLTTRRPDVVIVGSDPPFAIWVALIAARGRPVVYSLRDLHPEFAIVSRMIKPGLVANLWEVIHRMGLKRASLVVCLGGDVANRVRAKGVPANRIAVVPDGASPPGHPPDPEVIAKLRRGDDFLCLHAGNLGGAGPWEAIVEGMRLLEPSPALLFVGGGSYAHRVHRPDVRRVPFLPAEQLSSVMAAADLQIVAQRKGMEGIVVPSKLYTILAHGRPVLAVVPEQSEAASIVRTWECGLIADPDDPTDIAAKVQWARSHPEELSRMSKNALRAAQEFDRERLLDRFVALVDEVTATGNVDR